MGEQTAPGPAARLARLVVPVECPGCGLPDVRWCDECEAPWWEPPVRCESGAPRLAALDPALPVWSIAELDGPAHSLVAAWKDAGRRDLTALFDAALRRASAVLAPALGPVLGPVLGAAGDGASSLAVVPCPARPAHTRRRGMDVPAALARAAAAGLSGGGAPAEPCAALRPAAGSSRGAGDRGRWRGTTPRLDRRAWESVTARPAVLVDDVVTTGATLARAAAALAGTALVPVAGLVLASAPGVRVPGATALL